MPNRNHIRAINPTATIELNDRQIGLALIAIQSATASWTVRPQLLAHFASDVEKRVLLLRNVTVAQKTRKASAFTEM